MPSAVYVRDARKVYDSGFEALKGVNLSHYMPVRTILYDLLGCKVVVSHGKVQSDGEARGKVVVSVSSGGMQAPSPGRTP